MSSIEKPDFRFVNRFLKQLNNEYHKNQFKWRLNPYSDRSFQLWMHKVKSTFNAWKMDYKIIHVLFDLNVDVPYVLESIANLDDETPINELIRVVNQYSQYEILRQLRFEYWSILQNQSTSNRNRELSLRFEAWHKKMCRINKEVWKVNNVVFGIIAHFLRINCIKIKYTNITTNNYRNNRTFNAFTFLYGRV